MTTLQLPLEKQLLLLEEEFVGTLDFLLLTLLLTLLGRGWALVLMKLDLSSLGRGLGFTTLLTTPTLGGG
jgi:hypothetical protein